MPIVVSAFGPWGAIDENPTALVLDRLRHGPDGVIPVLVPVDTKAATRIVADTLRTHRPTVWLGLGLALGAAAIAVERLAVNLRDFAEPDIVGARPRSRAVVMGGPAAYLATVPVDAIVAGLRAAGIPAQPSNTAGTFLCNQLMYEVLHGAQRDGLALRAGFLHVPAHPALAARQQAAHLPTHPSMGLALMADAVRLALAAIAPA